MATWTRDELAVVEQYLDEHSGVLTETDYIAVRKILSTSIQKTRSIAAVKKKLNDTRKLRRGATQSRPAPAAWLDDEIKKLLKKYAEAEGNVKVANIRKILPDFPGRSEKGIA